MSLPPGLATGAPEGFARSPIGRACNAVARAALGFVHGSSPPPGCRRLRSSAGASARAAFAAVDGACRCLRACHRALLSAAHADVGLQRLPARGKGVAARAVGLPEAALARRQL